MTGHAEVSGFTIRQSVAARGFDRLIAARDRLLSDLRFQRWAARFPLTRHIARRRARALFDLCAGFVYSQVLLACVRLRLCEIVFESPRRCSELADRLGLPAEGMQRLLDAAVSLRLLASRSDDRYGVGPLGAALVAHPGIAAMVEHHVLLYTDLADPEALLRGNGRQTGLARYWAYATALEPSGLTEDRVAGYTALMAASQPMVAEEVLDSYGLGRHRRLLDVGGGDGSFLCAVAQRAPTLGLDLFDLPAVVANADARLRRAGIRERVRVTGGDFRTQALPRGADIVSLVRVIHDHDDSTALLLLRAIHETLPPGGTLLLAEPMSGTPGAEPVADAYFGLYLLAMGSGRPRRAEELSTLLNKAGFDRISLLRNHRTMLVRMLIARKPL
jgi:demethylspheroidene O-methyltransferase